MALKTPIYQSHVDSGGKIVDFAGFMMPVSFEGIVAEHERVRNKVGFFDVSHMGEIEITGESALEFADFAVSNNVSKLDDGQICYTVCCNEKGKVLDDLLVYRFSSSRILFVVNAVNAGKIYQHLLGIQKGDVRIENRSSGYGQIAVQGPASRDLLLGSSFCAPVSAKLAGLGYYRFFTFEHEGSEIILSRTGYTGEVGYEIYLPWDMTASVWDLLLEEGGEYGAAPIGLGARDTLRFEPCYCLYGHEIDEDTSPLEAGLSWVVKLKKDDFVGRGALVAEKEAGSGRKLIGLELQGRGIPRQGYNVLHDGKVVGKVTSGTFSPTLKKGLAMALVERSLPKDASGLAVEIRNRPVSAARARMPFYASHVND
ncbi:MAG: glycine cleavage system aminomethyltransferase GcvT [Candidatus Krumholzibacteriota bacterium]|nr:glycine cleavage system aminomethyltransferase GcvT [Candidatus Krumholzibacteriota bacterium]